jgi:hypothetical protein
MSFSVFVADTIPQLIERLFSHVLGPLPELKSNVSVTRCVLHPDIEFCALFHTSFGGTK